MTFVVPAVVNEPFNARVGRVLYMNGTRVMRDVIDKLDWVGGKRGSKQPSRHHPSMARNVGFGANGKRAQPIRLVVQR